MPNYNAQKKGPIEYQPDQSAQNKNSWITFGLFWGLMMFVMVGIFFPMADGEPLTWQHLTFSFALWILSGLGLGYLLKITKLH